MMNFRMNQNKINKFLRKYLLETGRQKTLDALGDQLKGIQKDDEQKKVGFKLSFEIQKPPKRNPPVESATVNERKRPKRAKIAGGDSHIKGLFFMGCVKNFGVRKENRSPKRIQKVGKSCWSSKRSSGVLLRASRELSLGNEER